MADAEAAAPAAKGGLDFLKQKIGPLPAGVWLVMFAGMWWYLQRRQKSATGTAGAQTDPAGNTGTIDPATGYVYGTSEDQAALAQQQGTGTGTATGSAGGSTVAGQYADNNSWAQAAINYLVSIGVDPTTANQAIENFLASQNLTAQQQADVNLAIQRLGAPPTPPQPGGSSTPIVTPPSGGSVNATNPPTGLTVTSKSDTHVGLKWNAATNAQSYTVSWGTNSAANEHSSTIGGTYTTTTVGNLKPDTLYYFHVQAGPAKAGDPYASTTATTAKATTGSGGGGGGSKGGGGGGSKGQQYTYVTVRPWTAKPGPNNLAPWDSTLWGIANHYHVSGGASALAKINGISDPNHITPGQKIKVPVS